MHRRRGRRLNEALDPRRLTRLRSFAFGSATLVAALVFIFSPAALIGTTRFVAAFDAATLVLLAAYYFFTLKDDPRETYLRAAIEDPGRNVVLGLVL